MADDDTTRIMRRPDQVGTPTVKLGRPSGPDAVRDEDPATRIYRPQAQPSQANDGAGQSRHVVGWLVVVEGPGRGRSVEIGFGVNSIGRSSSERIALSFGDEEISRERHATITYDHKSHRFYLQHGGGSNITYVGDAPVLQPVELIGRELIGIGQTKLCFIPFCGTDFSW